MAVERTFNVCFCYLDATASPALLKREAIQLVPIYII